MENSELHGDYATEVLSADSSHQQLSLDFDYDRDLVADEKYIQSLPDLQNGANVQGALIKLESVGIHNFRFADQISPARPTRTPGA